MQKLDRCEHCGGSHPHVSLQSCPPIVIGGWKYGSIYNWTGIPIEHWPADIRSAAEAEFDTEMSDREFDEAISETHTCTVYCPPECEFKRRSETADDRAFRTWHEREFGYRPTQANLNEDDSVFRSAFEAGRRFERGEGRGHDVSDPVNLIHTEMAQHDGYVPHSHEVRSDHKGVAKR